MKKSTPCLNKEPRSTETSEGYKHPVTGEDVGALLSGIRKHYPKCKKETSKKHKKKIFYFEEDLLPILKAIGIPEPIWGKSKTVDDFLDESETSWFLSDDFKEKIKKKIESETFGKGLPMFYMNDKKQIVEEWPNGKIIIKEGLQQK